MAQMADALVEIPKAEESMTYYSDNGWIITSTSGKNDDNGVCYEKTFVLELMVASREDRILDEGN